MMGGSSWVGGSRRFALARVEAAVVASQERDSERVGLDERSNSGGRASRKARAETAGRQVVDRGKKWFQARRWASEDGGVGGTERTEVEPDRNETGSACSAVVPWDREWCTGPQEASCWLSTSW